MAEKITVFNNCQTQNPIKAAVRCPHCLKEVIMETIQQDLIIGVRYSSGQRRCPNIECHGHVFVVFYEGNPIITYPPTRIDFNPENIPQNIISTFEQAITCHSTGCFVASAIMVRRTLEEVCVNRGAKGSNLKERIANLKSRIIISKELLEAMDELRILGNDAAHVEAKEYENVSKEETRIAIECAKEILKSLYQQESLLKELKSLKKA